MIWRTLLVLSAATVGVMAQRLPDDFDPDRAKREGLQLTAELLSQVPSANSTNTGTLQIRQRRGSEPTEFPLRITVQVAGRRWISLYEVLASGSDDRLSTLTILHEAGGPSHYFRGKPDDFRWAIPLTADEVATLRFAGSDFYVGDLGLEFLRWPVQRLIKKEMIRGQSCNVLESIQPNPPSGGYARVVSWLDIDTGGIVLAEAYDARRKRVKEFRPKSFKKLNGEWHLEEMRIDDLRTKSRTTVRFDVGEDPITQSRAGSGASFPAK